MSSREDDARDEATKEVDGSDYDERPEESELPHI